MTPQRTPLFVLAILVPIAAAGLGGGCAAIPDERHATFGIDFRLPEGAARSGAIFFMLDGVNPDIFKKLLDEGKLPNFKRYFVDRGLYVERSTANLPSVTLVNEASLVTGDFSGRHGILGNNWFDRTRLLWRNYESYDDKNVIDGDYPQPTLYERLDDATTFSLFYQVHRGASQWAENTLSNGPAFFFGFYGLMDRVTLWRFDIVAAVARERRAWPALTVVYQTAPDLMAYEFGMSTPEYTWALQHDDAHIGRILRGLEEAGLLNSLVLALTADHGMMDIHDRFPVRDYLDKGLDMNVAVQWEVELPGFEQRLAHYAKYSCVTSRGDRYWAVYLRKPRPGWKTSEAPQFEDWLARPSPEDLRRYPSREGRRLDLVEEFLKMAAVDALAYRAGPGVVHVVTKDGTVEFAQPAGRRDVRAKVIKGENPLGYAGTPAAALLDGAPHDDREWLRLTAETQYPDLGPQILPYFEGVRAPDIAVFAAPLWNFGFPNRSGHGGLRPAEMHVPLLMAGPGVPHERRPGPTRSVDLAPTLLHLLGRPVPTDIDGHDLLAK